MGRLPCCDKNGLKKGPWTPEEDQKLIDYIQKHGYGNWRTLPKNAGLQRCGKSCRLRWTNYLRPDIKRGRFSFEEEETIIQLHSILGNKWSAIAARLPGRTDNEIKNYWNTHIRKRLLRMGIDPVTHSPRLDLLDLSSMFSNSHLYHTSLQSSQMNMSKLLGLQPLANPDQLLKLAAYLFSTQHHNPTPSLTQENLTPVVQTTQIQAPIQNPNPNCMPFLSETQLLEPNYEQYPENISIFEDQWQSNGFSSVGFVSVDQTSTGLSYYGSDQALMESLMNFGPSIMSTPSSSPTPLDSNSNSNSNSNSSGMEDEREISYCSDLIKFDEIPDILDVNQFLLSQSNCS